jgi:hydroxymethylpyrimidine/phosphomethylpyrimidine kinase
MPNAIPRILIIAGSDSGGGAGIQADIKTITMLGGHAMTAITAITAQNSLGVTGVHPVPTEMVLAQVDAVVADLGVDAVKIGMIGSAFTADHLAQRLLSLREANPELPIVFDPVMVATSGSQLADDDTIAAFGKLMSVANLVTPNLPELWRLARGEEDPVAAAIDTRHTHGTGCTLASAIALFLAKGLSLTEAVGSGREFVRVALREAPGLGEGSGPMGHGAVRLDVGDGPRLNQVTVTGTDYERSVAFYKRVGLRQIVANAPDYARFETAGGVTLSVQIDPQEKISATTAIYLECDDLDARVEQLARSGLAFEHGPRNQPWMWREARLRDPDGNIIFFYKAGEARRFPPWRIDDSSTEKVKAG